MSNENYDVIIAGGGPAGSSAAIHLALRGARVLLAEQKKFPRPKLCGEFISPECWPHFERLGVAEQMLAARPSPLTETVFYSQSGAHIRVPSDWLSSGMAASGLSRAEMDERLLRHATSVGVDVLEEAQVVNLIRDKDRVAGVTVKRNGIECSFDAALVVDATGRARTLTRIATPSSLAQKRPASMVAFKAHFRETRGAPAACEIYSYRGGYGGLNQVENGLSNLCFIVSARDVRACQSNADRVMGEIVCRNRRAAYTLGRALVQTEWLAVSLEGFGAHRSAPADGLLAIGDAASFIDPFTGSGMLMALESGEMAAAIVGARLGQLRDHDAIREIGAAYTRRYREHFSSRIRLCSLLRRAAFVPRLADLAIQIFRTSEVLRRRVTRATRSQRNLSSAHSFK